MWKFFPSPQCPISYVESWIFFLALSGMGHSGVPMILSIIGNGWYQNCVDLLDIPTAQKPVHLVYFLSGILVHYHCAAGDLLCVCETDGAWTAGRVPGKRRDGRKKRNVIICF